MKDYIWNILLNSLFAVKNLYYLFLLFLLIIGCSNDKERIGKMNRLAESQSPYLLQHKNNPVDWYPWGNEAFQKAEKENKSA